jgi:hypothetical protein
VSTQPAHSTVARQILAERRPEFSNVSACPTPSCNSIAVCLRSLSIWVNRSARNCVRSRITPRNGRTRVHDNTGASTAVNATASTADSRSRDACCGNNQGRTSITAYSVANMSASKANQTVTGVDPPFWQSRHEYLALALHTANDGVLADKSPFPVYGGRAHARIWVLAARRSPAPVLKVCGCSRTSPASPKSSAATARGPAAPKRMDGNASARRPFDRCRGNRRRSFRSFS